MCSLYTQTLLKYIIPIFLICSFVIAAYVPSAHTRKVEAADIATETTQLLNNIQLQYDVIKNTITAAATSALQYKETVLDPLAWLLTNIILQKMTRDIISWINSGFKGKPAFITNMGHFLTDVADQVVGTYLADSSPYFKFICSPFKLQLQVSLKAKYAANRNFQSTCSISQVVKNLDGFINGNFYEGGWNGWYSMVMDPQNNVYGQQFLLSEDLSAKITNARGQELSYLSYGNGLMGVKQCDDAVDSNGFVEVNCKTVTPGTAIVNQLNSALDIPQKRLIQADEFKEILDALFTQLVMKMLSGAGGLLGLTDSTVSGGTGNYFDQIDNSSNATQSSNSPIDSVLSNEQKYLDALNSTLNLLQDAQSYRGTSGTCSSPGLTSELSSLLSSTQSAVIASQGTINTIQGYRSAYQSTDQTVKATVLTDFNNFISSSSGSLHTPQQLQDYKTGTVGDATGSCDPKVNPINAGTVTCKVQAFKQSVDAACTANAGV